MFREIQDDEIFRQFWYDEKTNSTAGFNAGTQAWHCREADFLDFCRRATVYCVNNNVLVYAEPTGEVHLSVLRGTDTSSLLCDLIEVRNELLKTLELLFAWVSHRNNGMRRLMLGLGFSYHGYDMIKGSYRNKPLEWKCYLITRKELFARKDNANLLNF